VTLEEALRFLAARDELRLWLREASNALWEVVAPPKGVFLVEGDLGPVERQGMVERRRSEWLSGLTTRQRTQILDELERTRIQQEGVARQAHWCADISNETLERWIGYLDERCEEARQSM